ncbi:hypothetical protein ACEPAI_8219 [Sanghuangporus weigelae]
MVDVLLVGATGYTGRLVTRYLATHRERDSFKFGIAARSKSKLDKLVSDFNLSGVQLFTVDVADNESIKALLEKASPKAVLTTVGPYIKWGKPLARACARSGVHYVDIGGEAPFVKDIIVELDTLASKTKTILVPSCGFDSVPSDVIAYLSALTLRTTLRSMHQGGAANVGVAESHTRIRARSGVSGGTIASSLNLLEAVSCKDLVASQAPDFISPIELRSPHSIKLVSSLPVVRPKQYGSFFPLLPYNISVVQRTRALFQTNEEKYDKNAANSVNLLPAYSDDYSYTESWAASNRFAAFSISLGVALFGALLMLRPFRQLAKRVLPAPGQGPSDATLSKGFLNMHNISISTPLPTTGKPIVIESHLRGHGDPGYALTAVMASEVALAVLAPQKKLPPLAQRGGVLTSMTALGPLLIERLSASVSSPGLFRGHVRKTRAHQSKNEPKRTEKKGIATKAKGCEHEVPLRGTAALLVIDTGATERVLVTVATTLGELLEVALAGTVNVELESAREVDVDVEVLNPELDAAEDDVLEGASVLVTMVVTGGSENVVVNVVSDGIALVEMGPGGRESELCPIVSVGPLDTVVVSEEGTEELEVEPVIGTLTVTVTVVASSEDIERASQRRLEQIHLELVRLTLTGRFRLPHEQVILHAEAPVYTLKDSSNADEHQNGGAESHPFRAVESCTMECAEEGLAECGVVEYRKRLGKWEGGTWLLSCFAST